MISVKNVSKTYKIEDGAEIKALDNISIDIKKGEIIIYKSDIGPELEVQMDGKTVWLSISQMAELFEKDWSFNAPDFST